MFRKSLLSPVLLLLCLDSLQLCSVWVKYCLGFERPSLPWCYVRPLKQVGMCEYASCLAFLAFFLHLSLQCILWNKVFLVWKLYWSCSVFEMIICRTRFLSANFGHSDYIILAFKAEFVCPASSDFIISSYLNASEALKLHTNVFSLYCYDITVSIVTNVHTWPDPSFDAIQHTWIKTFFFFVCDGNSYLKHTTF